MQRFLAHAATACISLGLLTAAQAQGPITSFSCSKAPGSSCTYKPVVNGAGIYRLTCTNTAAQPAPEVAVQTGPITECTTKVFPGDHTDVGCAAVGAAIGGKRGPETVQITATCKAK